MVNDECCTTKRLYKLDLLQRQAVKELSSPCKKKVPEQHMIPCAPSTDHPPSDETDYAFCTEVRRLHLQAQCQVPDLPLQQIQFSACLAFLCQLVPPIPGKVGFRFEHTSSERRVQKKHLFLLNDFLPTALCAAILSFDDCSGTIALRAPDLHLLNHPRPNLTSNKLDTTTIAWITGRVCIGVLAAIRNQM